MGFKNLLAVAISGLIQGVTSHTFMQHPVPFASQLRDNAPMEKDGSNWPCNGEVDYEPDGVMNIWERGSTQYLQSVLSLSPQHCPSLNSLLMSSAIPTEQWAALATEVDLVKFQSPPT